MNARYDFFSMIHKAIRSVLYDLSIAAGRADVDDAAVQDLARRFDRGLALLEEHATNEDREVLPRLTRAAPALAKTLEEEHRHLSKLALTLQASVSNLSSTPLAERAAALRSLYALANDLAAGHLVHMRREETNVNEALWRVHSDEELMGMTKRIVAATPPDRMAQWSEEMAKTFTSSEMEMMRKARQAAA